NGSFLAVRIFIEQPDRDLLRRNGLDPDGALYKMYDDLQNGQIDGEGVHRKKTRLDENSGDLLALAGGIDTRNPNRDTFLFDNVNIPAMINYWASSVIMHENDHTHKNYYAYRDTLDPVNNPDGTNEWMFLPWDKDLTFGINNGIGGVIADQDWPGDIRSPSHPFFGCSEHQKIDRQWNCLIDALHDNPVTRQMYLRRLRTLMDDLLQPPDTPVAELKFEKRIDELQVQLDIELGGSSFYNNLNLIKTNYLADRRQHLFNNHSIHNPGFDQNAGIPDAQPAGVIINFGSVEFNPASGNQDQEYIELINPAPFAVDISGWSMEDGVEHIFSSGTVIPAYGSLYVTPNAVAFRNRTTSPKGGEQLFVQGNYKGHLSSWGETTNLIDGDGTLVNTVTYPGDPSDQQAYLRITEVMYNPAEEGTFDNEDYEYIELKNIGDTALLLDGVRFTEGIAFDFPSISLPAGDYVLVAKNQAAFASRYVISGNVQVLGPYDGHLSNSGEDVKLEDFTNSTILEFKYRDGWYDITDGMGFSLTVNDPVNTGPNAWGDKSSWRPSSEIGGSPGWDDTGDVPEIGDVVINELLAHSHAIAPDWIELHNTTDQPINIGGWFLSDDSNDLTKYEVDVGTTIEPYEYVVFYEDQHFGNSADPGCNVPFALSENGEVLYLHSGRNSVITGYSQEESFGASETGIAFGLYQKSTGSYNFVAMSENTPRVANTYPMVGPVVISEIMYHPDLDGDAEYVELVNISDLPVSLYYNDPITTTVESWRFTDDPDEPGIELFFPTDIPVVLDPGEYILLVKKLSSFNSRYPAPPGVQIFEWVDGKLDNAGEKVQLSKPGDVDLQSRRQWIRVDRVVYSDGSHSDDFAGGIDPWPIEADGQGLSLSRIVLEAYSNDPANWQAAAPSPGVENK
ncbi:MAG: lamin tail domain-containing protein, partial [Planctomycetota bacterium]